MTVYPYRAISASEQAQPRSPRIYTQPLFSKTWQRFWWHTKAYSTIGGVVLVSIASLLFLHLHWLQRQFLQEFAVNHDQNTDPIE
jgi:hypothetical protein